MKKKFLKGFTLIELIIVMAIFSVVMVGAMSLIDPVTKIHSRANTGENSYSYVDNIQNYLQDSLEYADSLWVVQGNFTKPQIEQKALELKQSLYNDLVTKKDKDSPVDYGNCRIRVMTLLNDNTDGFKKGQILMQTVDYASDYGNADNPAASPLALSTAQPQLNDASVNDLYLYDYILGAGNLVKHGSDGLVIDSVKEDASEVPDNLTPANLAVTIVAYANKPDKNGAITKDVDVPNGADTLTIHGYPTATHYTIANLPLFNIIQRNGRPNNSFWIYKDATKTEVIHSAMAASPFSSDAADVSMDVNDNIYIIYAMADEIATP